MRNMIHVIKDMFQNDTKDFSFSFHVHQLHLEIHVMTRLSVRMLA